MTTATSCTPYGSAFGWVCARDFALHVRHMSRSTGVPWRVLAMLAGVSSKTVRRLMGHGRPIRRIRSVDAGRLMRITPLTISDAEHQFVDPASTLHRVRILLENGHSASDISSYLGVPLAVLACLLTDPDPRCTVMMRLRARAACEAHHLLWADQPEEPLDPRPVPPHEYAA